MDVLIADPAPFSRRLLRAAVETEHAVVGEAENGVELVERYEESDPDVVLLTVEMPIQDGIDATNEIRASDPDTAVVACVDPDRREPLERARRAELDGYLTVPYRRDGVLDAIEHAVTT